MILNVNANFNKFRNFLIIKNRILVQFHSAIQQFSKHKQVAKLYQNLYFQKYEILIRIPMHSFSFSSIKQIPKTWIRFNQKNSQTFSDYIQKGNQQLNQNNVNQALRYYKKLIIIIGNKFKLDGYYKFVQKFIQRYSTTYPPQNLIQVHSQLLLNFKQKSQNISNTIKFLQNILTSYNILQRKYHQQQKYQESMKVCEQIIKQGQPYYQYVQIFNKVISYQYNLAIKMFNLNREDYEEVERKFYEILEKIENYQPSDLGNDQQETVKYYKTVQSIKANIGVFLLSKISQDYLSKSIQPAIQSIKQLQLLLIRQYKYPNLQLIKVYFLINHLYQQTAQSDPINSINQQNIEYAKQFYLSYTKFLQKQLKLYEKLFSNKQKYLVIVFQVNNNLGTIFRLQKEYEQAFKYYKKGMIVLQEIQNLEEFSSSEIKEQIYVCLVECQAICNSMSKNIMQKNRFI